MNKIQRNFKKQMSHAERKLHREAKRGKGAFSNKLFNLRFYGYNYVPEKKPPFIFSLIAGIFKLLLRLVFILIFIFILLVIVFTLNKTGNGFKI